MEQNVGQQQEQLVILLEDILLEVLRMTGVRFMPRKDILILLQDVMTQMQL